MYVIFTSIYLFCNFIWISLKYSSKYLSYNDVVLSSSLSSSSSSSSYIDLYDDKEYTPDGYYDISITEDIPQYVNNIDKNINILIYLEENNI